jgi:NADPH:quinone reductase-like Zn-dependent oxidoreductase
MVLEDLGAVGDLHESTVTTPEPGPHDVLIRVETVSVNHQDVFVMRGLGHIAGLSLPHILGNDPAGTALAVGEAVDNVSAGDRVVVKSTIACHSCSTCANGRDDACPNIRIFGVHTPGGFAEYTVAPGSNVFVIPSELSFAEATAISQTFPVALNVLERGGLTEEDTVLVAGAAGGVGSAAVQLATREGARVVALASSDERVDAAVQMGATTGFNYRDNPEFASSIRELSPEGVNLYVEPVGDPVVFAESTKALSRAGRVVVCGSHGGTDVNLNLLWLFRNRASIIGSAGATAAGFARVLELAASADIQANIDRILPLIQVNEAFGLLTGRHTKGKLVLDVGSW